MRPCHARTRSRSLAALPSTAPRECRVATAAVALACVSMLAFCWRPADANPLFAAPFLSYDVAGGPVSVVVADVDGDGKLDLVTLGQYGSDTVSFLRGNGDGTFAARSDFKPLVPATLLYFPPLAAAIAFSAFTSCAR